MLEEDLNQQDKGRHHSGGKRQYRPPGKIEEVPKKFMWKLIRLFDHLNFYNLLELTEWNSNLDIDIL